MKFPCFIGRVVIAATVVISGANHAFASSIVLNGSLEDPNGSFVNSNCSYMALGAGSTAIANWTVAAATTGQIVWADSPTCDSFTASDGDFFVDLSGFGASSPNGALEQLLATTIGETYAFSIDLATINNGGVSVMVGADLLTLSAGSSFLVGSTSWTPYTALFVATSSSPLLSIGKASANSDIVFVDNVSITARSQSVADPASSVALLGLGLATLGGYRRRLDRKR